MTATGTSSTRRGSPPKTVTLAETKPKTEIEAALAEFRRSNNITSKPTVKYRSRSEGRRYVIVNLNLSGIERHELVKGGLSTQIFVEALEAYSEIPERDLLHAVGLSTKTLGRREDAKLGPRHSDAALALLEVTDIAQRVLGNRKLAEQWLKEPSLALDGRLPLDLISTTPGIETVKDLLTRMEYGVYA